MPSTIRILRGHDVRRKQRGNQTHGLPLTKRLVYLEQTDFGLDIQAVPGFGFDRRDTQLRHLIQTSCAEGEQRIGARAPGGGHRPRDSAA